MTFAEHVIVITGASAGIGKAVALALAPQRPKLVLAARNLQRLEDVARQCQELGAETLVVPTDVTQESQCRDLIARSVERFGRLDVLVNNAGRAMWSRFDHLQDLRIIEDIMRLNYFGSVYCTYYALPHLKKSRGRIVAMSSVSGLSGIPMLTGYSASKHAVIGFFDSLRIELAKSGVSVTVMAPDFVQSEILERAVGSDSEPLRTSPLDQNDLMPTSRAAAQIVKAMAKRKRLVLFSERSKYLGWGKLLFPGFVDRMASRAVKPG